MSTGFVFRFFFEKWEIWGKFLKVTWFCREFSAVLFLGDNRAFMGFYYFAISARKLISGSLYSARKSAKFFIT